MTLPLAAQNSSPHTPVDVPSHLSIKKIETANVNKLFKPLNSLFSDYFPQAITKKEIDENLFSPKYKFLNESLYFNESDFKRDKMFRSLLEKLDSKLNKGKFEAFILDFSVLDSAPKSEHNFNSLLLKSAQKYSEPITDDKARQECIENYLIDFAASVYATQFKVGEINFLIAKSQSSLKSIKDLQEKVMFASLESLSRTVEAKDLICELLLPSNQIIAASTQRQNLASQFIKNFNWEIESTMLTPTWGNSVYVLEELKKDFFGNLVNIDFDELSQDSTSPNFVKDFINLFFEVSKKSVNAYGHGHTSKGTSNVASFFSNKIFDNLLEEPYFLEQLKLDNEMLDIVLNAAFIVGKNTYESKKFSKFQEFLFDNFLSKKDFYPPFITFLSGKGYSLTNKPYLTYTPQEFLDDRVYILHIMKEAVKTQRQHSSMPNVIQMFGPNKFLEKDNFLCFCSVPYLMKLTGLIDLEDYREAVVKTLDSLTFEEIIKATEAQGDFLFYCIAEHPTFLQSKTLEEISELMNTFSYSTDLDKNNLFNDFYLQLPLPFQQNKELLTELLSMTSYTLTLPQDLVDYLDEKTLIYYVSKNPEILRHTLQSSKFLKDVSFIENVKFEELYKFSRYHTPSYLKGVSQFTHSEQERLIINNPLFYKFASPEVKKDNRLAWLYGATVLEKQSPIFADKLAHDDFIQEIPKAMFLDPDFSLKVVEHVPQLISSLVPREFWHNQKFILKFCAILDKKEPTQRTEILKSVSPNIEKLFKAFDIKPGSSYDFMVNYFEKIQLNKELKKTEQALVSNLSGASPPSKTNKI